LRNPPKAIPWIEDDQLGRRNLTADRFTYFIGRKYEREKKVPHRPTGKGGQNDHLLKTATAVAEQHGLSEKTSAAPPTMPTPSREMSDPDPATPPS
jgi:hypothetical protein